MIIRDELLTFVKNSLTNIKLSKMKKFLSINYSDGKLYEISKEEKEDWVKYESKTGKVSYRKYYDKGATGVFQGIKLRNWEYGDEIQVFLKDGDDQLVVAFKIYTQKGNVDDTYMIPFIQVLPNMEVGETYTIFPYNFTPDGEKYAKRGVSVKQNGERVDRKISMEYTTKAGEHHPGDIPQLDWKEDKLSKEGKKKPTATSIEKRDETVKEFLSALLERLPVEGTSETEETKSEEPKREEKPRPTPSKEPEAKTGKAAEEAPKKKKLPF